MEHNLQAADSAESADSPPHAKRRTQFGFKEFASGKNPNVDIVAIHGIDGDREYSWTAENGVLWLRDLLPAEIPNARILTYGYDAKTHGQDRLATDFMHEHAMNFVSKLALLRENSATVERPIIFVAHSSGGLLLKSALIHSHLCNDNHLRNHRAISLSTHAVAFFGTPHLGSATAELARSILDTKSPSTPTSTVLLRHLERDSEALQHQLMQYSAISGQFETKYFYEIYDTDFAGVSKRMVPRASAVVPGAVNAEAIGIHKDHVNMIKFPSVEDEDFRIVSTSLCLMSKAACQKAVDDCHKSTIKIGTENVAKVEHDVKAVTGNVSKKFNPLSRTAFPRAAEARFDMGNRDRCLEGTRVKLLDTVLHWALQNNSPDSETNAFIFWLCGQAGTGKTTICSSVADRCHAQRRLGASFFFSRDRDDRNNMRLVFPTIAYQLGIFCNEFGELYSEILRNDPDLVDSDPNYQLEKLIINPLKDCASFPFGTIIVMDALDECKDSNPISTLLSIIYENRQHLTRMKFFITSRPENNIRAGFRPRREITESLVLHDIDTVVVNADIELYLRNGFSIVPRIYPDLVEQDWPSDEAIISLVNTSSRLFIFAATALKFIMDESYSDPINQLRIILEQSQGVESSSSPFFYLDQLYLRVLRQAFPNSTPSDRLACLKFILGAIVLIRNPLSPGDLEVLLGLRSGIIRTTLRHLHSIMVVPDTDADAIRLIHPSFFDFAITDRCRDLQFRINVSSHHEQLATFCLEQMKNLKRNICQIEDASKLNKEIQDLPKWIERHIPPALRYACHHWVFHVRSAPESTPLKASLNEFCHGTLLYWIEALSLIGPESLRGGIRDIQALHAHVNNYSTFPNEPFAILKDTAAFIAEYFDLISSASLQLYQSALPFSSPSNSLRNAFSHELSGGVQVLQRAREANYSALTVLRGHTKHVRSAEFSPDGTLVVSATDDEIRLWDRGTGTLSKTLRTDSTIIWVKFFPHGERIASGSIDDICIWDVTSGTRLRTTKLEQKDHEISHYTCSPDVTRIIGSAGRNIMIWDVSNGSLLHTLTGHKSVVECLAFSQNSMLIASGDETIRIWDAVRGTSFKTLTGHPYGATAVAFSQCNSYLISCSFNEFFLWDISLGTSKIFRQYSDSVKSVAFSLNSMQIIFGSVRYGVLRVWDVGAGKDIKKLRLGGGEVKNVGISFDGSHYICTWGNGIYIWNADQTSDLDQSAQRLEEINCSPDGSLLIAVKPIYSFLWDVFLRDGLTGDLLFTDRARDCRPVFSPNNRYFTIPLLNAIDLWDISSRAASTSTGSRRKLRETSQTRSVAFSSDSTQIVSTSLDNKVRIWDTSSGNQLFTIYAHHVSVIFSSDGSQLIADNDHRYDIPPNIRSHPVPLNNPVARQLPYSIEGEWVFITRGDKKERCIWLPVDWRNEIAVSSSGRVAISTHSGFVLLDLSGINLSP